MSQRTLEVRYKAQGPTLAAFIADRTRRAFIMGPLGSGKTNASCYKALGAITCQPPDENGVRRARGAAIRNTYPDLLTTTAQDWLESYSDLGRFSQGGLEPPCHELAFALPDGTRVEAELHFIAIDRPAHVRKLRGLQLTFAWLNEVKELGRATLDMLDLRVGRFQPGGRTPSWFGVFGDTNACDVDHWYYELAEEMRPEGYAFFRQPGAVRRVGNRWEINPQAENVANLPLRERYYLDGLQGKNEDWIRVNLANEYGYVREGRPVHDEYRDEIHCAPFELDARVPLRVGLDFGLTPAATIGQRLPSGRWLVRHEVVSKEMGATNYAQVLGRVLRETYPNATWHVGSITGDPAGDARGHDAEESTVFQILRRSGINAQPANTNEPQVRRDAVSNALLRMIDGKPGYQLHPDCRVLRKAMQGAYCYRRLQISGMEQYRDVPDKNEWSHVADAQQYMFLGAGEGRSVVSSREQRERPARAITEYASLG